MTTGDRVVTFQGHHSYLVSIAKLCKENGLFTDVTILCDDGKLVAHRIVLAAVSPFLCHVLDAATGDTPATTIIMPDVRKEIVQQLLEFLYTGIMKVSVGEGVTEYLVFSITFPCSCPPPPPGSCSSSCSCYKSTPRMLGWTQSAAASTPTSTTGCPAACARPSASRSHTRRTSAPSTRSPPSTRPRQQPNQLLMS